MSPVTDAEVLTRSSTSYEPPRHGSTETLDALLDELRAATSMNARLGSFSPSAMRTDTGSTTDTLLGGSYGRLGPSDANHSTDVEWLFACAAPETRATTSSATTVSSLRRLLKGRLRDERLRRLPPERRRVYDNIKRLRKDMGPVDFDVVRELRKLREDG